MVIVDERSGVNNKVDIWSIGLILYELITRKHLFRDPFDVVEYVRHEDFRLLVCNGFYLDKYLESAREWRREDIRATILQTISVSPQNRPFATALKGIFYELVTIGAFPDSLSNVDGIEKLRGRWLEERELGRQANDEMKKQAKDRVKKQGLKKLCRLS